MSGSASELSWLLDAGAILFVIVVPISSQSGCCVPRLGDVNDEPCTPAYIHHSMMQTVLCGKGNECGNTNAKNT